MKYKYNNQWKDLTVKAGDTLPIGTIVDYDGDTVPNGYEQVEEKSLIDLYASASTTLSTSATKINYNTERTKIGTKFTNYDGGVKIGAGVSKVKVTINQGIQNSAAGIDQKRIELFINTTSVRTAYNTIASATYNSTTVTLVAILAVQENDVLYVKAAYDTKACGTLTNNYSAFIVEEI